MAKTPELRDRQIENSHDPNHDENTIRQKIKPQSESNPSMWRHHPQVVSLKKSSGDPMPVIIIPYVRVPSDAPLSMPQVHPQRNGKRQ
mmetsp:Transcript_45068/g.71998  ORF Transcript_45068/g.71998 Transcript_45068/m.71998 type:complete len:88 (-) Transcript_45068:20-283(-)